MRITVNSEPADIAAATLSGALAELGYGEVGVATSVNGAFVPREARAATPLTEGDRIEVLAPMQGG